MTKLLLCVCGWMADGAVVEEEEEEAAAEGHYLNRRFRAN